MRYRITTVSLLAMVIVTVLQLSLVSATSIVKWEADSSAWAKQVEGAEGQEQNTVEQVLQASSATVQPANPKASDDSKKKHSVFLPLLSRGTTSHPANPNASWDTRKVLSYIAGLADEPEKRVISGQHVGFHVRDIVKDYERNIVGLEAETGKWVALIGTTFGLNATPEQIQTTNREVLIPYWNAGGLITLDHHAYNPWTGGTCWDLTDRDLIELIDPESDVYDTWMAELDKVAVGLAELRDAGVVVLWRPFHEMTYNEAFWWDSGAHGGEWKDGIYYPVVEPYVNMWRHMFNYFTYDKGLDNLLWVYCPAGETDNWNRVDSMWPGDDYVDIVGLDVYNDNLTFGSGDAPYERLLPKNKPIAFFETGPRPTVDGTWDTGKIINAIKASYPKIVLWQSWSSWEGSKVALVDNQNASGLLNDSWVLTRDELDWRSEPTPTPSPTPTPTLTPTTTPTPTPTQTLLPTSTPTATNTPLPTDTPTPTSTSTPSPTNTPTSLPTNTPTFAPTNTPTLTPISTPTPTATNTPLPTYTPTPTSTSIPSPTNTPTSLPTNTPTFAPTNTPVPTNTPLPTNTPTLTPTSTPTPTPTADSVANLYANSDQQAAATL